MSDDKEMQERAISFFQRNQTLDPFSLASEFAQSELARAMRPSPFDHLPRVVRHLRECAKMAANDEVRVAYDIAAGIVEHELKHPPLVPVQRPSTEDEG